MNDRWFSQTTDSFSYPSMFFQVPHSLSSLRVFTVPFTRTEDVFSLANTKLYKSFVSIHCAWLYKTVYSTQRCRQEIRECESEMWQLLLHTHTFRSRRIFLVTVISLMFKFDVSSKHNLCWSWWTNFPLTNILKNLIVKMFCSLWENHRTKTVGTLCRLRHWKKIVAFFSSHKPFYLSFPLTLKCFWNIPLSTQKKALITFAHICKLSWCHLSCFEIFRCEWITFMLLSCNFFLWYNFDHISRIQKSPPNSRMLVRWVFCTNH